jgi:Ca2+-binding EF-hand superfamily protein
MFKAFQSIDLDRSGRLSKKEISRALDLWNVPISDEDLDLLLSACDQDNDGGVSYEELVDKLARGTVAPAAMGKRGMQSKEAMGVDSQEMLAHQLGHNKQKKFVPTINSKGGPEPAAAAAAMPMAPMAAPAAPAAPKKLTADEEFAQKQELKGLLSMAEEGLNSRFSDMYKAFQYVDLDRSGRLSKKESSRALDLWNVPIDDAKLDLLLGDIDADNDGGISYEEFVDALARGTVAPAAQGKRGMQSKEAMGVSAYAMLDEQLGHADTKFVVPTVNKAEDAAYGYMMKK